MVPPKIRTFSSPTNILSADVDQRVPFLLREARRRGAADFSAIGPAGTDAAKDHLPSSTRIDAPGVSSLALQSRQVNNFLFQDTLTTLRGRGTAGLQAFDLMN